jgi:hypothetical protein
MKKIGLLCLALVLALGSLGVGYAAWTDTIFVNGTVSTGNVDIGFSKIAVSEPNGEVEGKEVGEITSQLSDPIAGCTVYYPWDHEAPVYEKAEFFMTNAYPCYQTSAMVDVATCGTVPVKITDLTVSMAQVNPLNHDVIIETLTWVPTTGENGYFINDEGETVFEMIFVNLVGTQLHRPEKEKDSVEIDMHLKQPAEQNAVYIITITITGTQWDEA